MREMMNFDDLFVSTKIAGIRNEKSLFLDGEYWTAYGDRSVAAGPI